MLRSCRALTLAALVLSFATAAFAHGPPPAATGLLALGAEEVTLVRLTRGLAYRVRDGFRFLCPEAWDGDPLAPAAAIPGGPALVASELLFIVTPDGRVTTHPSSVGAGIALASNRDALFGLFERDGQYELRRITESSSDLVRGLDESFGALAASDSQLFVLGWAGSTLVLQTVSLGGELSERVTWGVFNTVAYAELRMAGEELYVLVWGSAAPWVTLGRMTESGYEPLRKANTDITGPVAVGAVTLVAVDGRLETLEDETKLDARGDYVTCLGSDVGAPYACAHGDVLRVAEDGLGATLFELASLGEPDYQALPEAARLDCATRWLDLRDHLAASGASSADAGTGAPDAAAADAAELTPGGAKPAGCALGATTVHAGWFALIILALLGARRRPTHVR